jgi:hypothetical protein
MDEPGDDDVVRFEVGRDEQNDPSREWRVSVLCSAGLSEFEFAAALQTLADDILQGKVAFDTAPDVGSPDRH